MGKISDHYKIIDMIYKTEESCISLARKYKDTSNGDVDDRLYVIKEYADTEHAKFMMERERKMSQIIDSKTKMRSVIPICETLEQRYLVMEYQRHGMFLDQVLNYYYKKRKHIQLPLLEMIMLRLLEALEDLHTCGSNEEDILGYLHMDIHPGNVFLENLDEAMLEQDVWMDSQAVRTEVYESLYDRIHVCLIDLQSAIEIQNNGYAVRSETEYQFTEGYSAPEKYNYNNQLFDVSSDLYSVAVILDKLLQLSDPARYHSVRHILHEITDIGTESSPVYRFAAASEMLDMVQQSNRLLHDLILQNYIESIHQAFYMNVDVDLCSQDLAVIPYDDRKYTSAVDDLTNSLLSECPNQKKCLYIYQNLSEYYKKNHEQNASMQKLKARLLSAGIGCYNNLAMSKQAAVIGEEYMAMRNEGKLTMKETLPFLNRIPEIFYDLGEIEQAITMQEDNRVRLIQWYDSECQNAIQQGLAPDDEVIMAYARSLSACGRYYCVRNKDQDLEKGLQLLEQALTIFDQVGDAVRRSGNRAITIGHIMNAAVDTGNRLLFKTYAAEYYHIDPLTEASSDIWLPIMEERNRNADNNMEDYILLAALKCVYCFGIPEMTDEEGSQIEKLVYDIYHKLRCRDVTSYPVNLICKYIGLILYERNQQEYNNQIEEIMNYSITADDIFEIRTYDQLDAYMIMTYQTMWIMNDMKQNARGNDDLYQMFLEHSGDPELGLPEYHKIAIRDKSLKNIIRYT